MPNAARNRAPFATIAVALLSLAFAVLPLVNSLEFDREAVIAGQAWRLWTGHLVHFSLQQLFLDIGAVILVGTVAESEIGSRFTALALLIGMPVLSAGLLLLVPDLVQYRGASGMAMLLAFIGGTALWYRLPEFRAILAILVAVLATKATLDAVGLASVTSGLPSGIKVAWHAHVLGAGIGWAYARVMLKERM